MTQSHFCENRAKPVSLSANLCRGSALMNFVPKERKMKDEEIQKRKIRNLQRRRCGEVKARLYSWACLMAADDSSGIFGIFALEETSKNIGAYFNCGCGHLDQLIMTRGGNVNLAKCKMK